MNDLDELHAAAAAYALDALDADEREEFEAHLSGCASCRRDVADYHEVAGELASLAEAPAPPPSLRAAVLGSIAEIEQLPPLPGRPRRALSPLDSADGTDGADEKEEAAATGPVAVVSPEPLVDELALRRASRRTRALTALVAAVSVVALALGVTVVSLAGRDRAPVAGQQLPGVDPSLLAAPDAKIYPTTLSNGARVSFVVSKQRNQAAFVGSALPSPGAGNVYHLWTLKGTSVVRPDSTLPNGAQSQGFTGPVDDSTSLAVNIEPAGTNPERPTTSVLGAVKI